MGMESWLNAGADIVDSVADALESGDFSNLSQDIQRTVGNATAETADSLHNLSESMSSAYYAAVNHNTNKNYFLQSRPSKVLDIVKIVMGAFWTCFWAFVTLGGLLIIADGDVAEGAVMAIIFGAFTIGNIFLVKSGSNGIKLIDRFHSYAGIVGNKQYFTMEEISRQTGEKKEKVIKNLQDMIKKGYLKWGKFDDAMSTFMLTSDIYQQYLDNGKRRAEQAKEDAKKAKEEELRARQEAEKASKVESKYAGYDEDVRAILEEGDAYIATIHKCNEEIPDAVLTAKLDRMEAIMNRIFDQVKKEPETSKDLRKFIDYYLPTTTKLLYAYIDLEKETVQGENIKNTKRDIEDTIDSINDAFEKLLDSMFEEMAWDISSDINVMKHMMAQDGLTDTEMK